MSNWNEPWTSTEGMTRKQVVEGIVNDPAVQAERAQRPEVVEARAGIVNPGLAKTKDPRVPDVLISLLDDPSVGQWAAQGLGRIRHTPARPCLEQALNSPNENLRHQAKKALKRLTS